MQRVARPCACSDRRMRYPALVPAVALIVGATGGTFLPVLPPPVLRLLLMVGWGSCLIAFVRNRHDVLALCFLAGFAVSGWSLASTASAAALNTPLRQFYDGERSRTSDREVLATVTGRLQEDAGQRPWGASLSVRVDHVLVRGKLQPISGGLRASVTGSLVPQHLGRWRAGRQVRFPVQLRRSSTYLDPGVPNDQVRLAWRGTALVGSVKSAALVEVLARGNWFQEGAAAIRGHVRQSLLASVGRWHPRSAAIITAILIGDRAGLDDDLERRLQEAGTYHVIAISGGNIAILAALLFWILRSLRIGTTPATCVTIGALIAYACLVGAQSSVARATLMAVAYLAARLLDHRTDPINAVAVAITAILCVSPLSIADPGFVLTFGATTALIVGVGRFRAFLPRHVWLRAPVALLVTSLCAEAALFPVSAFAFSRVTFAGLALNLLAVPLMTLGQIAGMAVVALTAVHSLPALAAGWLAHAAAAGLAESATWVDVMPWLSYRLPPPGGIAIVTYYVAVSGWLFAATASAQTMWPEGRAVTIRHLAAAVAVLAALWILIEPVSVVHDALDRGRVLRIAFLDVGQGDSTLLQFPGGQSWLVDAGGGTDTFDLGARVIAPALWALHVRRLDTLAITHGDPDHIGGAPAILGDFVPRDVWDGVPVPHHEPTKMLRELAERQAVVWRTLQSGDRLRLGGAEVHVWHPPPPDWERRRVRNDDSLVVEIRYGRVSIILPGDIGRDVERGLAPHFAPAGLRVLKAAHHGSLTSSSREFLDALRPAVVVFSCGRDNPYGHPAPEVVRRYEQIGASILRTDEDGAILLETDGREVRIKTYTGRVLELMAKDETKDITSTKNTTN